MHTLKLRDSYPAVKYNKGKFYQISTFEIEYKRPRLFKHRHPFS